MRAVLLGILLATVVVVGAYAQQGTTEQQIRARIEKLNELNTSGGNAAEFFMKPAIFWSGAYAKPQTGIDGADDAADRLVAPGRKNQIDKTTPEKIVVAKSSDMAYEYSTFVLNYDDGNGHHQITGALLRVWQQDASIWKIAAEFRRGYGRVVPVDAKTPR
jgi:ketosteroid isomerase-like protein